MLITKLNTHMVITQPLPSAAYQNNPLSITLPSFLPNALHFLQATSTFTEGTAGTAWEQLRNIQTVKFSFSFP